MNILKMMQAYKQCCTLGCDCEGTVKIDLIDGDTLQSVRPKYFCEKHAPSTDDGTNTQSLLNQTSVLGMRKGEEP